VIVVALGSLGGFFADYAFAMERLFCMKPDIRLTFFWKECCLGFESPPASPQLIFSVKIQNIVRLKKVDIHLIFCFFSYHFVPSPPLFPSSDISYCLDNDTIIGIMLFMVDIDKTLEKMRASPFNVRFTEFWGTKAKRDQPQNIQGALDSPTTHKYPELQRQNQRISGETSPHRH